MKKHLPLLANVMAQFLFGIGFLFTKMGMAVIDQNAVKLLSFRYCICMIVLSLLVLTGIKKVHYRTGPIWMIFLCGLFNPLITQVLEAAEPGASCASWAVRFAAGQEGVYTVLSGMSDLAQMEDNLRTMRGFAGLTEAQREVLRRAQETLAGHPMVPCTGCDYCAKACPAGVGISGLFEALNVLEVYGDRKKAEGELGWNVDGPGRKRAGACVKCGACEAVCPQHIAIREVLERAAAAFG